MGVWFFASAAPGFIGAYKTGLNATTWHEMNQSGKQWGDSAGQLGVNSALGFVGYRIGAGITGNILARNLSTTLPTPNKMPGIAPPTK